jgi:Zn finger protein HypA/HybF involved in hydrogenase expression
MHEMSIALEVCRLAEERLGREALPRLVTVGLDVGDGAGVEVLSLKFCLEAALAAPPFAGAKPAITRFAGDVLRLSYLEVEDDDGQED